MRALGMCLECPCNGRAAANQSLPLNRQPSRMPMNNLFFHRIIKPLLATFKRPAAEQCFLFRSVCSRREVFRFLPFFFATDSSSPCYLWRSAGGINEAFQGRMLPGMTEICRNYVRRRFFFFFIILEEGNRSTKVNLSFGRHCSKSVKADGNWKPELMNCMVIIVCLRIRKMESSERKYREIIKKWNTHGVYLVNEEEKKNVCWIKYYILRLNLIMLIIKIRELKKKGWI